MKKQPAMPIVVGSSEASVLEDAGIAFDPLSQHVDLTKDEKRRTTALVLAIQAYDHLIVKDAEMYVAMKSEELRNDNGPILQPATIDAMVEASIKFDMFIAGAYSVLASHKITAMVPKLADEDGK